VLRAVSPLIWRRVLVPGEASLTDLHRVLQAAFGWSDVHLHRFKVHGREYDGIYDAGRVRIYPVCTGGRRSGPPEDCGGPRAFLERFQPHRVLAISMRVAEIIGEVLDDSTLLEDYRGELAGLAPWLAIEQFDRRALNRELAELACAAGREERVA